MNTPIHVSIRMFSLLTLVFFLAACGGKRSSDALDAARDAVMGAEGSERCAEAEYQAARNLLDQATEAYNSRDFARARQLAEAAQLQAERAREVAAAAEANGGNCDPDAVVEETSTSPVVETNTNTRPVITDYDMGPIFFDFDQSSLTEEARETLSRHAEYLLQNTGLRLTVQGHCDELGSSEYNLALGEQRARTVVAYLVRLGVVADRLHVVSYGEEMPLSGSEQSRNRRAEFIPRN